MQSILKTDGLMACKTAEQSFNLGGSVCRGIGGSFCRGMSGSVYRGISGSVCADSPNLPQTTLGNIATPVITGLSVSPTDPLKVWVTFTGYDPDIKVYYSDNGGNDWYDADPAHSLVNLPVNGIVYQEGTDDRLYIATDAGVYVKDNTMTSWERYGDIPNVRVTELRINPCSGKLTAATFGRGIWECDLLPAGALTSVQEINQDEIWSINKHLTKNLTIKSGNTLTLTAELFMPAKGKIIIEPNARLILDGGKVSNSCNEFWQGIEVWGNKNKNQFPGSHPTFQGKLLLQNGAIIEHAKNAVTLWKPGDWQSMGGVIVSSNSFFKNNTRSVEFISYINSHPQSGNPYRNLSGFLNTSFIVDDDYRGVDDFSSHVSLWAVDGVTFAASTFENNQSNLVYNINRNKAIYSIDAGYKVMGTCDVILPMGQPCPEIDLNRSSFKGFNYAIHAQGSGTQKTVIIDQSLFEKNANSIYMSGVNNFAVTRSNFVLGENTILNSPLYSKGIGSFGSSGYHIEENNFSQFIMPIGLTMGIEIINSGQSYNELYKNSFSNLTIGERAAGKNKNTSNNFEGLQFLCNLNSANSTYDFNVTTFNTSSLNDGVRAFQGEPNPDLSAGNTFSHFGSPEGDFFNNTNWPINYYHDGGQNEPVNYSPSIVLFPVSTSNVCASRFNDGARFPLSSTFKDQLLQNYNLNQNAFYNILYSYLQLIDGGNTPSVLQEIELSWPPDAWDLRTLLMSYSPYLSLDVLKEVCERGILPDAMVLEICLANPDATRSEKFIQYMQFEMPNSLPDYMVNLIRENWDTESQRTLLESTLAHYSMNLAVASDLVVTDYKSSDEKSIDDIISILQQRGTLTDTYSLIELYIEQNNFGAALALLNNITSLYKLDEFDIDEFELFMEYYQFRLAVFESEMNISTLGSIELAQLEVIANRGGLKPAIFAQNILCFFYNNCIHQSIDPENSGGRQSNPAGQDNGINLVNDFEFNLYPNPCVNYLNLSWNRSNNYSIFDFCVKDISGRIIKQITMNAELGVHKLNTMELENGIYIYEVSHKGEALKNGQIIVQH